MAAEKDKVAVVTGANKGIGFEIVKGLCKDWKGIVYLTARDVQRGERAVAELKTNFGYTPLFHQLDVIDKTSINRFKEHIVEVHGGIDLLINNAAIGFFYDSSTPYSEQVRATIDVNYFGVLYVCESLFPILKQNAKVVNISSDSGHISMIDSKKLRAKFINPNLTVPELNTIMTNYVDEHKNVKRGSALTAYNVSKVGMTALTMIQQREFDKEAPNRNISVNAVHPGYVKTDMNNGHGILSVEDGAKAPLFVALKAENWKGKYVWDDCTLKPWDRNF